jgi:hypothetical protein
MKRLAALLLLGITGAFTACSSDASSARPVVHVIYMSLDTSADIHFQGKNCQLNPSNYEADTIHQGARGEIDNDNGKKVASFDLGVGQSQEMLCVFGAPIVGTLPKSNFYVAQIGTYQFEFAPGDQQIFLKVGPAART